MSRELTATSACLEFGEKIAASGENRNLVCGIGELEKTSKLSVWQAIHMFAP